MSDIRPQKAKVTMLVKAHWNYQCALCWNKVNEVCETMDRETPALQDREFFVPYVCFDWKCKHNHAEPYLFESAYAKRQTPSGA